MKYGKIKLPHNQPQENKVPPAEWRPGVGVVKNIKSIRLKYRRKSQPSENVDSEKACQILKDGEANGQPLTDKQRGMFGAACGKKSYFSDCPRDDEGHCRRQGEPDQSGKKKPKRQSAGKFLPRGANTRKCSAKGNWTRPWIIRSMTIRQKLRRRTPAKKP